MRGGSVRCAVCDTRIRKTEAYVADKGTPLEGKSLCETCYYEDEPAATVFYGRDEQPYIISEARNETEGDFSARWRSTDPWRGYYETKSEKYALVNTAELLSYHESEKMLKDFDEKIKELFDEHGINYARVFARSSNVFYQNYDLYVKKDQTFLAGLLIAKVKNEVEYDNPKNYRNVVFDENTLSRISELFPEENIQTDYDAINLLKKYENNLVKELQKRLHKLQV